jgi:hypothetical protein
MASAIVFLFLAVLRVYLWNRQFLCLPGKLTFPPGHLWLSGVVGDEKAMARLRASIYSILLSYTHNNIFPRHGQCGTERETEGQQ